MQLTDVGVPTRAQRLIGVGPHLLTAGILAAFVLLAANFAHVQAIWVDETTQLSGLTLSPAEQLPWLAGENANRFGVPPDRQPPLSYFLGWTWSRIFGLTPLSMRYFGLAAVALAGLFVAATATRVSGPWGGPLAATLFLLSPNVLGIAPEIRPYPLFLLWAAMGFWCLTHYARRPEAERGPWLWAITAVCLAASYTHYYGGVMTVALFGTMLLIARRDRATLWPIVLAGAAYAILATGLVPFVAFAFRHSLQGQPTGSTGFIRLIYRLVANPVLAVDHWALGLMLAGVAGLAVFAFAGLWRDRDSSGIAILAALAIGLAIVAAAGLILRKFDAYSPSYNIWLLPGLAVFLTLGLKGRSSLDWARVACAGAVCIALVWSGSVFAEHGPVFVHGPHKLMRATVAKYGPKSIVIYENSSPWGFAYFPLRFDFGPDLGQDRVTDGPCCTIQPINGNHAAPFASALADRTTVIVVRLEQMNAVDLRRHLRVKPITIEPGALSQTLAASPDWRRVASDQSIAFVSARVDVFVRARQP